MDFLSRGEWGFLLSVFEISFFSLPLFDTTTCIDRSYYIVSLTYGVRAALILKNKIVRTTGGTWASKGCERRLARMGLHSINEKVRICRQ